jgi:hypothetical protein
MEKKKRFKNKTKATSSLVLQRLQPSFSLIQSLCQKICLRAGGVAQMLRVPAEQEKP